MGLDDDVPGAEDIIPCSNKPENSSDSEWNDWQEQDLEITTCLFCPLQFLSIELALEHCKTFHQFNLAELKSKFNMDFHSYIKMINYIRKHKPLATDFANLELPCWNDDKYLKPIETESWLMYDFDEVEDTAGTPHLSQISEIAQLQKQINVLTVELKEKNTLLEEVLKNVEKMREVTKNIVEHVDECHKPPKCIGDVPVGNDSDYFNSYAHYNIHLEMLSDTVRTESYRDAILKNANTFKDKLVLDVGCGTSILSMFAASAGAEKVYAIDQSDVVFKAMDIVRSNNLQDKIELIHGRLEDTKLPHERVDIIISEWMGYFLLFEGMLDSVIYARDHHLKPGGIILPNKCNIQLTACSDKERYDQLITYWDDVYGYKMHYMKADVIAEAVVEVVPEGKIVANSAMLTEIDINTCTTGTPDFKADFELMIERTCDVTGLVGYFDTFFDLDVNVAFSTGPKMKRTHWQQTVFYLPKVLHMVEGEKLCGKLICMRKANNVRGLSVKIHIGADKYEYNID